MQFFTVILIRRLLVHCIAISCFCCQEIIELENFSHIILLFWCAFNILIILLHFLRTYLLASLQVINIALRKKKSEMEIKAQMKGDKSPLGSHWCCYFQENHTWQKLFPKHLSKECSKQYISKLVQFYFRVYMMTQIRNYIFLKYILLHCKPWKIKSYWCKERKVLNSYMKFSGLLKICLLSILSFLPPPIFSILPCAQNVLALWEAQTAPLRGHCNAYFPCWKYLAT